MVEIVPADEFTNWFDGLGAAEMRAVARVVELLRLAGVTLGHPYSSEIKGVSTVALRELRAHNGSVAIRVFYAFDPARSAVLLLGGKKQGSLDEKRFYKTLVPQALAAWERYLAGLAEEGEREHGGNPQGKRQSKAKRKK